MKILELKGVSKSFGSHQVLKDIDIDLEENQIVGLLGPSGSGKTTIFNIIVGNTTKDSGQVLYKKREVESARSFVSYMVQDDLLFDHLTIIDNVSLPLRIKKMPKKEARDLASPYFEDFGLESTQDKYPSQLSGGMRQRAALLRTYLGQRDIWLLDEPFSALDMITKSKMHQWFLGLVDRLGISCIFVSHDIDEAIKLSDVIYVLTDQGTIGGKFEITKDENLDDFVLSDKFIKYKKEIIKILK